MPANSGQQQQHQEEDEQQVSTFGEQQGVQLVQLSKRRLSRSIDRLNQLSLTNKRVELFEQLCAGPSQANGSPPNLGRQAGGGRTRSSSATVERSTGAPVGWRAEGELQQGWLDFEEDGGIWVLGCERGAESGAATGWCGGCGPERPEADGGRAGGREAEAAAGRRRRRRQRRRKGAAQGKSAARLDASANERPEWAALERLERRDELWPADNELPSGERGGLDCVSSRADSSSGSSSCCSARSKPAAGERAVEGHNGSGGGGGGGGGDRGELERRSRSARDKSAGCGERGDLKVRGGARRSEENNNREQLEGRGVVLAARSEDERASFKISAAQSSLAEPLVPASCSSSSSSDSLASSSHVCVGGVGSSNGDKVRVGLAIGPELGARQGDLKEELCERAESVQELGRRSSFGEERLAHSVSLLDVGANRSQLGGAASEDKERVGGEKRERKRRGLVRQVSKLGKLVFGRLKRGFNKQGGAARARLAGEQEAEREESAEVQVELLESGEQQVRVNEEGKFVREIKTNERVVLVRSRELIWNKSLNKLGGGGSQLHTQSSITTPLLTLTRPSCTRASIYSSSWPIGGVEPAAAASVGSCELDGGQPGGERAPSGQGGPVSGFERQACDRGAESEDQQSVYGDTNDRLEGEEELELECRSQPAQDEGGQVPEWCQSDATSKGAGQSSSTTIAKAKQLLVKIFRDKSRQNLLESEASSSSHSTTRKGSASSSQQTDLQPQKQKQQQQQQHQSANSASQMDPNNLEQLLAMDLQSPADCKYSPSMGPLVRNKLSPPPSLSLCSMKTLYSSPSVPADACARLEQAADPERRGLTLARLAAEATRRSPLCARRRARRSIKRPASSRARASVQQRKDQLSAPPRSAGARPLLAPKAAGPERPTRWSWLLGL